MELEWYASFAAPGKKNLKSFFVREVQTHSCEWLKPEPEMAVPPLP